MSVSDDISLVNITAAAFYPFPTSPEWPDQKINNTPVRNLTDRQHSLCHNPTFQCLQKIHHVQQTSLQCWGQVWRAVSLYKVSSRVLHTWRKKTSTSCFQKSKRNNKGIWQVLLLVPLISRHISWWGMFSQLRLLVCDLHHYWSIRPVKVYQDQTSPFVILTTGCLCLLILFIIYSLYA